MTIRALWDSSHTHASFGLPMYVQWQRGTILYVFVVAEYTRNVHLVLPKLPYYTWNYVYSVFTDIADMVLSPAIVHCVICFLASFR